MTVVVLNLKDAVHHTALHEDIRVVELGVDHVREAGIALFRHIWREHPVQMLVFNPELAVVVHLIRWLFGIEMRLVARSINTLSELRDQQTSVWRRLVHALIASVYRRVDHIIAQSEGMADDLLTSYGFQSDQLTVIHNPVNQAFLPFLEKSACSSAETQAAVDGADRPSATGNRDDRPHEILFVGRLSEQKGLHWLLEAAARLAQKRDDFLVRLVGRGPEEPALKQMARELGITEHTRFEGYQTEIIPYYQRATCTVLTSKFEGFPNVLVESTAVGTPVVSFDCPSGPREIIKSHVNGRLVPIADTEQFAAALDDTLDHSWDQEEIRETAMRYHPERILDRYDQVVAHC